MGEDEIKGIVRIAGKDIEGNIRIPRGLTKIKGIGQRTANLVSILFEKETGIDRNEQLGKLGDKIDVIKSIITDLDSKTPAYLLNRRNDVSTGKSIHIVGSDVALTKRDDVKRMQKVSSYIGIRHSLGLTVRGQRTKTTGRKNKTIGVRRKKK